jgi:hypothetical protein
MIPGYKMDHYQTDLKSKFLDKKILKDPASIDLLYSCAGDEMADAVSVWKNVKNDKEISSGLNVFRRATEDEKPKKLISILKIKRKNGRTYIDDRQTGTEKYGRLLDWGLQNAQLETA